MNNIARCFVMFFIISLCGQTFADEWIAYRENITHIVEPKIDYIVPQYQPVIYYQPVPYVVYQNIIVEKQCFFHRTQTIVTKPVTQYYYQPVVLYR